MQRAAVHLHTVKLPPLILHPFSDATAPGKLVESSRASLMLQGFLPSGELNDEELERRLLDGRYCEIRMLYYVGRDVRRWLEQCVEVCARDAEVATLNPREQDFALLLIENSPMPVLAKLKRWGVADFKAIFSRGLALNALFAEAPGRHQLGAEFIRDYYRYTDAAYKVWLADTESSDLPSFGFEFELFASGEYSRMLERQWEQD